MIKNVKIISFFFIIFSLFSLELKSSLSILKHSSQNSKLLNSWELNRRYYYLIRFLSNKGAERNDFFHPDIEKIYHSNFPFTIKTQRIAVEVENNIFSFYKNTYKEIRFLKNIFLLPKSTDSINIQYVIDYSLQDKNNLLILSNLLDNISILSNMSCKWREDFSLVFTEGELPLSMLIKNKIFLLNKNNKQLEDKDYKKLFCI